MAARRKTPQKIRPNATRQLILVGLAIGGIGLGYGVGFIFKKEKPAPIPAQSEKMPESATINPLKHAQSATPKVFSAQPILPEATVDQGDGIIRAYEEALPQDVVESQLSFPEPVLPPPPLPLKSDVTVPTAETLAEKLPDSTPSTPVVHKPEAEQEKPSETKSEVTTEPVSEDAAPKIIQKWQQNAVTINTDGRPKIAIVFDDMGVDRRRSKRATELPGPLTLSYLTYGNDLAQQTRDARGAGHELMMHIPMEPTSATVDPGPNVLLSGMGEEELLKNLRWNLDQFDGYIGVNNHMGSRFTSNLAGMKIVLKELKRRGLLFLDSVTSAQSQGRKAAKQVGIPFIVRNVFLDHVDDLEEINQRLRQVEQLALKQGHVVAIGHPRETTLKAIIPWLETIEERGFQLVPLSTLITIQPSSPETAETSNAD